MSHPWKRLRTWTVDHDALVHRVASVLAVATPLLFLLVALVRAAPFVDDVPLDGVGDDWITYKQYAVSILRDGLHMPIIGTYTRVVHGFFYNYFLAGVFAVFGENSSYAYVIHSVLLGTSASLVYLLWRRILSALAGLVLLVTSATLIFLDVYRAIGFRLLSENLFIFLLMLALLLIVLAHEREAWPLAAMAGVVLGLAVLSRSNFFLASLALVATSSAYALLGRVPRVVPIAFSIGLGLALGLLPLRELVATGTPDVELLLPKGTDLNLPSTESPLLFIEHYVRQGLFTLGFTTAIEPSYRWRPHWMLIWAGFFAWAVWRVRAPRFDLREITVLVILVLYLGPILAVSYPSNYGGRMLTVIMPLVLALGVLWCDRALGLRPVRRQVPREGLVTTSTT